MGGQPGFFGVEDRLRELSAKGDDLERIAALVDFEKFRPDLERAVPRSDGAKGGRPAFDHVLMFKVLLLQAMHAPTPGTAYSKPRRPPSVATEPSGSPSTAGPVADMRSGRRCWTGSSTTTGISRSVLR